MPRPSSILHPPSSLQAVAPLLLACFLTLSTPAADSLSLAGAWRFTLNGPKPGDTQQALPQLALTDTIQLPGTTDTNRKGPENPERWRDGLTRLHKHVGPAWYERQIVIPASWHNKQITLFLERTKYTQVWLDGQPLGDNPILCTPQEYALGSPAPGAHQLTILIDNSRKPVNAEMHQMSENTQGNWNGVIGRLELRATPQVWLEDVQVYPDVAKKSVCVKVQIRNTTGRAGQGTLSLAVKGPGAVQQMLPVTWGLTNGTAETELSLGQSARLWDEFHPALYSLRARLRTPAGTDERETRFGLREFKPRGTQFAINGRATFLRGKHDGCVFPLTGHPPMDVAGWLKYLRICREYGINHIRFHTWTPPEAAFAAADQLGMYLQPELPFWGQYTEKERHALMPEAERILKCYGNHPSFVMLSLGNECGGSREVMGAMVQALHARDPRRLYAQGSNNYYWDPRLPDGDDYWTTIRTGTQAPAANVRGSFATVDGGNGCVQLGPPATTNDYSAGIAAVSKPVIGHEIGQYTVYPNFKEVSKYTGVFRARNFELFREKLTNAGMLSQADEFFQASGKLAGLCYREEVETALRTAGFGGFQLLDLQDFPGQGTALVGLLDAFMESKGIVAPEQWRQSCSPVVLLARFDRYTWTTEETFKADLQVAHYGEADLFPKRIEWKLRNAKGHSLASGQMPAATVKQGGLRSLGQLTIPLASIPAPAQLELELRLPGAAVANSYPLWVYPARLDTTPPTGVTLARSFDAAARERLAQGGRVVLIPPAGRLANTVGGGFATDFWCWPMFHNNPGTMGLLCNPKAPALAQFPTRFHSSWQWFHLVTNSQPIILNGEVLQPIVQVIDNLDRNHKLGLIFEAQVGKGRLLVCATDLLQAAARPEARQLLRSLLDYAASEHFQPCQGIQMAALQRLLASALPVQAVSASSFQSDSCAPTQAIDGNQATRWCAADASTNQWLMADLGQDRKITGCAIRWEFDKPGYAYVVEASRDGTHWFLLSDQRQNTLKGQHRIDFPAINRRFVRVTILAQPKGAWASIRDLAIIGEE